MKKLISHIATLIFFVVGACDTANNVEPVFETAYIRYFGTEGDQFAADILAGGEGSLFLLGNNTSLSGSRTAFLVRTDFEGNVIWERQIGGEGEIAVDVERIVTGPLAGNLVVVLNVGPESSSRIRVLRLSENGDGIDSTLLPLHQFGGFKQIAKSITPLTQMDGYIVTGYADNKLIKETAPVTDDTDVSDILAFRLDNTLALVDTVVTKGGERNGAAVKAFELDGDYAGKLALFSYTDRPNQTNAFGYNFSCDVVTSGIPVGKLLGTEDQQEVLSSVVRVPSSNGGGFLMGGTSVRNGDGLGDLYLVRYDDGLQYKALDKTLPLGRNLQCIDVENSPAGFLVLSNEMSTGEFKDIVLMKVMNDGAVEWSRSFGTREGDDVAAAVTTLPDGRIAVAATMELQTKRKLALIVLNSDGNF
jgi:hypothetical protein